MGAPCGDPDAGSRAADGARRVDPSITGGAEISLIGVSVVFMALISLVIVVSVVARTLAPRRSAETAEASASTAEVASKAETPIEWPSPFEAIALAAYGYHRRRSQRIRTEPIPTQWEIAGRMRQLARSDYRN